MGIIRIFGIIRILELSELLNGSVYFFTYGVQKFNSGEIFLNIGVKVELGI